YQFMRHLPEMMRGDARQVWVLPMEFTRALDSLSVAFGPRDRGGSGTSGTA
ncbi:MAG: hypothetical protein QG671_1964, partial [Actinomycetota bacterium]|nr:hypothetical protein [Actinomycetota bacterium]